MLILKSFGHAPIWQLARVTDDKILIARPRLRNTGIYFYTLSWEAVTEHFVQKLLSVRNVINYEYCVELSEIWQEFPPLPKPRVNFQMDTFTCDCFALTLKSMPTVEMKLPARKAPSLKRTSRQVFPTPESPTSITWDTHTHTHRGSWWWIKIKVKAVCVRVCVPYMQIPYTNTQNLSQCKTMTHINTPLQRLSTGEFMKND